MKFQETEDRTCYKVQTLMKNSSLHNSDVLNTALFEFISQFAGQSACFLTF